MGRGDLQNPPFLIQRQHPAKGPFAEFVEVLHRRSGIFENVFPIQSEVQNALETFEFPVDRGPFGCLLWVAFGWLLPSLRLPVLFAQEADINGHPVTPLHGGHVGLLCTAGMLKGVFGVGEARHVSVWQSVKLVDRTEDEEDGATVVREKERFSNELTLTYSTGDISILK